MRAIEAKGLKSKLSLPLLEGDIMKNCVSLLSQLYHFLVYSIKNSKMQLENSMLIISIDVDVGSRELGVINKGKNDANVHRHLSEYRIGEIEELVLPLFVETFNDLEIPVTFAIRGQLTEVDDSILALLLKSSPKHDIGAHGYYHKPFKNLSRSEAENELKLISVGMKKFGIVPTSFVFPKNSVAHLDLLEKYGYKCYRSYGGFMNDCLISLFQKSCHTIFGSIYGILEKQMNQYEQTLIGRCFLCLNMPRARKKRVY